MNETFQFAALMPILPEIGLAVGAMILLMLGAIAGERTVSVVVALSVLLLAIVGYFVAIEAAQTQHPHEILAWIEFGGRLFPRRRHLLRGRRRHAHSAATLQFRFDQPDHSLLGQAMLAPKLEQRLFLLRRERFVVQGESDVFI